MNDRQPIDDGEVMKFLCSISDRVMTADCGRVNRETQFQALRRSQSAGANFGNESHNERKPIDPRFQENRWRRIVWLYKVASPRRIKSQIGE
jgi:hypothetical protein